MGKPTTLSQRLNEVMDRVRELADHSGTSYRDKTKARAKAAQVERMGGRCKRCHWIPRTERELAALHLHHTNPALKGTGSQAEQDCLELICANCHAIEHAGALQRKRRPNSTRKPINHHLERWRRHYLRKHDGAMAVNTEPTNPQGQRPQ